MATANPKAATTKSTPAPKEPQTPVVTGYDTDVRLFATRYKQGGRTVYSLIVSPDQIVNLFPIPDPAEKTPGNRQIRPNHALGFMRYFREQPEWVSPGMLLRTPEPFEFETLYEVAGTDFGIITLTRLQLLEIQILDGQHRILGFHQATASIKSDLDKARSQRATARKQDSDGALVAAADKRIKQIEDQGKRLTSERLSLEIHVVSDPTAYKQMFFDIADNALGITASVKARFDTRKVVNRALETVLEHPLLLNRVDIEADRVGRGSQFLLGAKHVAEIVRSVQVGLDGRVSAIQDKTWNEKEIAKKSDVFLDLLVASFPQLKAILFGQITPDDLRKSSLLGSVLMLRVLAGVYHDLVEDHAFTGELIEEYFGKLSRHMEGPIYEGDIWTTYVNNGVFSPNAMGPHGRRQDMKYLKNQLVAWALDKPKFLDEAPAPRPAIVEIDESFDPLAGAGYRENPLEELAMFEDK